MNTGDVNLYHVMFDIDGTLVKSFEFDEQCYLDAVHKALGQPMDSDWSRYKHITDSGILDQHLKLKGLLHRRKEIHPKVKAVFIENIRKHILKHPVEPVAGAIDFLERLKLMHNVSLSIATGGWGETARMKLRSAGFDISGIPMSSSNDHYSRTEIMKTALSKSSVLPEERITYFGDAEWDKKACEHLGINFVLLGNRVNHNQSIPNFTFHDKALTYIGL